MDRFSTVREQVRLGGRDVDIFSLQRLGQQAGVTLAAIPFVGRVLLEAQLRAGDLVGARTLARRLANAQGGRLEMRFRPARVLVQDYTGIPLLVDLAAIREHVGAQRGAPEQVYPAVPTDVVVDHSVQVDVAGVARALLANETLELERNHERYAFLKWAEQAFANLRVIPPGRGIVHQVNLERLATLVVVQDGADRPLVFPDTVIGTDSHTTMVNGLGVLGWGVGGLEAEAVMLGLDHPMAIPPIVGVRLSGQLRPGVVATDVVLSLTAHLRAQDVRGLLLEFTGPGAAQLSTPDRCTIANMAPEYGAMAAFFPVDAETLRYLRQTGRDEALVALVEAYQRHQRLMRQPDDPEPCFSRVIEFDLGSVATTLAGPSQPHQRLPLADVAASFARVCPDPRLADADSTLADGDIVIAAITSCTSTSSPKAMLAAGLLARRAVEHGLLVPAHVKTSLAPGSRSVTRYLAAAGLLPALESLGFHVVGYGCTTCNGGSGPLASSIAQEIERRQLTVCAVLSGNRNFEGRIHTQVRASYLASPAMVVAFALKGHVRGDLETEPLGHDQAGRPVFLADLWPSDAEIAELEAQHVGPAVFVENEGPPSGWKAIPAATGLLYPWGERSTYIRRPPYLDARPISGAAQADEALLSDACVLALLGDYVSTDHISPVGAILPDSPAGRYLQAQGVLPSALNAYGARRGNYEVMARGTFANSRLRNQLLPGIEGGETLHLPTAERVSIYEAATRYARTSTPLLILGGKSYGMGSSRDWAAKGPWLLGVRAIIAESFEWIHRANLCAMGILPLLFPEGQSWASLGLDGRESFVLHASGVLRESGQILVRAARADGSVRAFMVRADIHTGGEWEILLQGGMLPYLLRSLGQ